MPFLRFQTIQWIVDFNFLSPTPQISWSTEDDFEPTKSVSESRSGAARVRGQRSGHEGQDWDGGYGFKPSNSAMVPIRSMWLDDLPSHFPLFMWPFFTFHVDKSSSPMDPMGLVLKVA